MGNITFGSFIAEKRKAHKFNLRDTAKHLNIAYGYLCDIEQSRRPAPNGDFVERIRSMRFRTFWVSVVPQHIIW